MKLRNIIATCGLLAVTLVGGLSAAFTYNGLEVADILIENIPIEFGENDFIFEEVDGGDNFKKYIDKAIVDINSEQSVLIDHLIDRLDSPYQGNNFTYFGSMAVSGGNAAYESVFGDLSEKISVVLEAIGPDDKPTSDKNSVEYYILYLTNVDLGEKGTISGALWWQENKNPGKPVAPVGNSDYGHNYIYPIYKTTLKPNESDEFTYQDISIGAAQSCWYAESNSNGNVTQIPCFNTETWKERTEEGIIDEIDMKPGGSKEHAIWVYAPVIANNGRTEANTITVHPEVYVGNNNTCYYKNFVSPLTHGGTTAFTYSFALAGNGTVDIYDYSTDKHLLTLNSDKTSDTLSVKPTSSIYFKFTGNEELEFTISR